MRASWAVVRRHRVLLFVVLALSMLAGILFILFSTPDYQATASIEVQNVPAGAAGTKTVATDMAAPDNEATMETQVEVLRSRALAQEVATAQKLGSDAFFQGMGERRPVEGRGALTQRQVETDRVVGLLRDNLKITLPGKSRVILIGFTSADPVLSARIANAYADALIRMDLKRGFESGVQARRFLLGELDGARRNLERAERDLAVYASRTGQGGGEDEANAPPGAGSSVSARLAQLSAYRAQATSDRIAAQKRWESARASSLESLPEVLGNGAMQQMMAQRAALRAQLVQERQFRRDAHPEMREARAHLAALDDQVQSMANTIRASVRDQYDVSVRSEKQIEREIAGLEGDANIERGRDIQFGIMERSVDTYRTLHDSLLQRYRDMASQAGFGAGRIQPLDRAAVPARPSSPDIGLTMLIASLGGLLLGLILVGARHMFDDAVTSADTLAERADLPMLGAIPMTGTGSPPPDTMDPIASSLLLASVDGLPRSILVTSAQPEEGKSATVHALALALARLNKKVLVMDADMRRPVQHNLFRLMPAHGISEVLTGQASPKDVIVESSVQGLSIMPCGAMPPNPAELLSTTVLDRLLAQVQADYDTVLIDAPPILSMADAPLLAAKAQATVMVIEWGRNHHGGLRVAVDRLRRAGATIVGAILTKQHGRVHDYDYHRGE
ncbi:MAG: polysaccharide biosynthesis tyrosine autokinase [Sphingobium sp.]